MIKLKKLIQQSLLKEGAIWLLYGQEEIPDKQAINFEKIIKSIWDNKVKRTKKNGIMATKHIPKLSMFNGEYEGCAGLGYRYQGKLYYNKLKSMLTPKQNDMLKTLLGKDVDNYYLPYGLQFQVYVPYNKINGTNVGDSNSNLVGYIGGHIIFGFANTMIDIKQIEGTGNFIISDGNIKKELKNYEKNVLKHFAKQKDSIFALNLWVKYRPTSSNSTIKPVNQQVWENWKYRQDLERYFNWKKEFSLKSKELEN